MIDPNNLIDLERKTVSPRVFSDPEVHQAEQERIFTRCWLYVGHESQIPNPGDFVAGFMGEEPVIVVSRRRPADTRVPQHVPASRDAGLPGRRRQREIFSMPLSRMDLRFLEGNLTGVPDFRKAYHGDLKREEWPLLQAPKVTSYHGLIFACLDEHAVTLKSTWEISDGTWICSSTAPSAG